MPRERDGKQVIAIRDFRGMQPNSNPHAMPPGVSVRQVNVIVGPRGELRVRKGVRQVKFDP